VQGWAHEQGLSLLTDYAKATVNVSGQSTELVLLSPGPNTTYRIDPTFDASAQQLEIEAAVGLGVSRVTIWVDGKPIADLDLAPYQTWWSLSVGEHEIWAQGQNANGELIKSEVVTITVVAD
jgi:hypothetical protein